MQWYEILALSLLIWLVCAVALALVFGRVVGATRGDASDDDASPRFGSTSQDTTTQAGL